MHNKLALALAIRSGSTHEDAQAADPRLSALEDEHRLLSERRRRLHESIDMLEALGRVKPDAALRLERYKITETEISRRRRDLYRVINELRAEARTPEDSL
jgi:hypothetical protein